MKKNDELKGKIGVLFVVICLAYVFISGFQENPKETLGEIFLLVVLVLSIGLITNIMINRKQLSKIDFRKEKDYYREILETTSPLILGFIDDFKINKNRLIAELLHMKFKNIIDIEDEKIKIINQKEISNGQKYILKNIKDGKIIMPKEENFYSVLKEDIAFDAEYELLIKINRLTLKKISIGCIIWILLLILVFFSFMILPDNISLLIFMVIGLVLPVYILRTLNGTYRRTKKGEELNRKIEGLKIYLKDYSMLDKREASELELWEDYLIYSVLFGQNEKIVEEYEKYIK